MIILLSYNKLAYSNMYVVRNSSFDLFNISNNSFICK